MIRLDWSNFDKNSSNKRFSFEQFCWHLVYTKFNKYGLLDSFYNTPGSEFYLTLEKDVEINGKSYSKGNVIGWQCKYWLNHKDNENSQLDSIHREELKEGLKKSLKSKPNLNLWIICTPGKFINTKNRGKKGAYDTLLKDLSEIKNDTDIVHWHKDIFEGFQNNDINKFQNLYSYYFSIPTIHKDTIINYSEKRFNELKTKFDIELYTSLKIDEEILLSIDLNGLFGKIENLRSLIDDAIKGLEEINNEELLERNTIIEFYELYRKHKTLAISLLDVLENVNIHTVKDAYNLFKEYNENTKELVVKVNKNIKNNEYEYEVLKDDYYKVRLAIDNLSNINSLLFKKRNDNKDYSLYSLIELFYKKDIKIISNAGYGKTNAVCNIYNECLQKKFPVLFLLGSSFRFEKSPKETIIRDIFELEPDINFSKFLSALNTIGLFHNIRLPIIIDGLNESSPFTIWKKNIQDIISEIENFDNLILITTCRDKYTEAIFEVTNYIDLKNHFFLEGFSNEKDKKIVVRKYFNKYNIKPSTWLLDYDFFKGNPLLLKIFSEVNKGKENIHINISLIYKSIEEYLEQLIDNISRNKETGVIDKLKREQISSGVNKIVEKLWFENKREIDFNDFCYFFDENLTQFIGSLPEKIIDEGLCFQKNYNDINKSETVQFTYDLISGYAIAKFLISDVNEENLIDKFKEKSIEKLLKSEHPFSEDILKSLIYFIPKYTNGKQLIYFYPILELCNETINNLDFLVYSNDLSTIEFLLSKIEEDKSLKTQFINKLFECIYNKRLYGFEDLPTMLLKKLSPVEIDIYWTELIRKKSITIINYLLDVYENNEEIHNNLETYFSSCLYCCGSSDTEIRNKAINNLSFLANKDNTLLLKYLDKNKIIPDLFIQEGLILATCGFALNYKNISYLDELINLLLDSYLVVLAKPHIKIIDCIQTIILYAKKYADLDYTKRYFDILKEKVFEFNFDDEMLEYLNERGNIEYVDIFRDFQDFYDFNKYQINSISSNSYTVRDTFSNKEIMALISSLVKSMGYEKGNFEDIYTKIEEENSYKYKNQDKVENYIWKYVWIAYYQIVGNLFLLNKIKTDFSDNALRFSYGVYDPCFPLLPKKRQYITNSFLPKNDKDIQSWINAKYESCLDDYLTFKEDDYEWVMIRGYINQEKKDINIHINIKAFFSENIIAKNDVDKYYYDDFNFSSLFSGEINWRDFLINEFNELSKDSIIVPATCTYSWYFWSTERMKVPNFIFLNPIISNYFNLVFNTLDLTFYSDNEPITKILHSKNSNFYFIRKDFIDKYINETGLKMYHYEFISKQTTSFNSPYNPAHKWEKRLNEY